MKFGTATQHSEGFLDCVHIDVWVLTRSHRLKAIDILSILLMIYLGIIGYTL